jgi:hypothetical protein
VERLLKLGADVNKAPVNTLPPLVIVVLNVLKPAGNPDEHKMRMIAGSMIFDMLALKGAYVNGFIIEPERPETPITLLDIAIREKDPFAEAMLRDHGAKTGDDLRRLNREIVQSKGSHKRKQ